MVEAMQSGRSIELLFRLFCLLVAEGAAPGPLLLADGGMGPLGELLQDWVGEDMAPAAAKLALLQRVREYSPRPKPVSINQSTRLFPKMTQQTDETT